MKLVFPILTLAVLVACSDPSSKLPNYGAVPRFTMTDSLGHSFDSSSLGGKVWIADFIYSSCPGPCPMMTQRMHQVQERLKNDANVELISFSIDPVTDTPPVLNAFAHHFGGPKSNWLFLTGDTATVHRLAHDVFKVGDVFPNVEHSTKFMVVDKHGDLRGYYSSNDEEDEGGIRTMLRDVRSLEHQRS